MANVPGEYVDIPTIMFLLDAILAWNDGLLPAPVSVTTPAVLSSPVPGVMDHAGTAGMLRPLLNDGLAMVTFPALLTNAV